MDQDKYLKILEVKQRIVNIGENYLKELNEAKIALQMILTACDHVLPNGLTSVSDNKCLLCGKGMNGADPDLRSLRSQESQDD